MAGDITQGTRGLDRENKTEVQECVAGLTIYLEEKDFRFWCHNLK